MSESNGFLTENGWKAALRAFYDPADPAQPNERVCKMCKTTIRFCKGTTNLKNHLTAQKKGHTDELARFKDEYEKNEKGGTMENYCTCFVVFVPLSCALHLRCAK